MIIRYLHPQRKTFAFVWMLLLGLSSWFTSAEEQQFADGVVAIVNDKVITFFEVTKHSRFVDQYDHSRILNDSSIADKEKAWQDALRDNRQSVVRQLVDQELILADFKTKGYFVPDKYIEQRLNDLVVDQTGGDWEKFRDVIAKSRTTLDELRERIRRQLSVELYVGQIVERRINISPSEARDRYDANPGHYRVPAQVRLQMIVVDPDKYDESSLKDRISTVRTALSSGQDFVSIAKEYSDSAGKEKADDFDWLEFSDLAEPLQQPIKSMATGEFTGPISLGGKKVFIRVADKKGGSQRAFDEVRTQVRNEIFREKREALMENTLEKLRRKAYIRYID